MLQRFLQQITLDTGVIGIDVSLVDLIPFRPEQLDLFNYKPQQQRLREAVADLIARYGADCFYEVIEMDQDALLIERRFDIQPMQAT